MNRCQTEIRDIKFKKKNRSRRRGKKHNANQYPLGNLPSLILDVNLVANKFFLEERTKKQMKKREGRNEEKKTI